jgi:hypothetical protein
MEREYVAGWDFVQNEADSWAILGNLIDTEELIGERDARMGLNR